jgi:hypothetical protein
MPAAFLLLLCGEDFKYPGSINMLSEIALLSGSDSWQPEEPVPEFTKAKLALGERMVELGIDDGETCELVAALDDLIEQRLITGEPIKELFENRDRLVQNLAYLALEDSAQLPGAEAEFARARRAMRETPPPNIARMQIGRSGKRLAGEVVKLH